MNRHRAGFTLIELMVVMAIIAIMLMLAVPSFASFISNYRATSATNDFLQGVTLTRGEALKRGRKVLMLPNTANGTPSVSGSWTNGWTIFVDSNANQIYDSTADELIFQHSALQATIRTSGFTSLGAASSTAFLDGTKTYIQFDGTGFPRLLASAAVQAGGIVITDVTVSAQQTTRNTRTLCVGRMGRAQVVQGVDPSSCQNS